MDKGTLGGPPDGPPADGPGNLRRRFEQAAEGLPDRPGYEIVWTAPTGDQEIIVSMAETIRLLEECKAFVEEHGPTEGESTAETLRREGERRRAIAEDARHRAADLSGFLDELESFPADMDVNEEAGRVMLPQALQLKGLFTDLLDEDHRTWAELWREATLGLTEARQVAETQGEAAESLLTRSEMLCAAVHTWRMAAVSGAERASDVEAASMERSVPDPQPVPKVQGGAIVYREGSRWRPLGQWIMYQVLALDPRPKSIAGRARAVCEIMDSVMSGAPEDVPHPKWVRDSLLAIRAAKMVEASASGRMYKEFFGPKQLAAIEALNEEGKLGVTPLEQE